MVLDSIRWLVGWRSVLGVLWALLVLVLASPAVASLPPLTGVERISANESHTCAVTTSGGLLCWGKNDYGQLGDGTHHRRILPTQVTGLESGVQAVAVGGSHTCALMVGGAVLCWGRNTFGQLGDASFTDRLVPTPVSGLGSGVQAIAGGNSFNCALSSSNAVLCWGSNLLGQLGSGGGDRSTPGGVSGLGSGVRAISAGHSHGCAIIHATGGLKCWGYNAGGQLGDGTKGSTTSPVPVIGLGSGVLQVSAGVLHTCAVTTDGAATCWGNNFLSQLGDGSNINRLSPVPVTGLGSGVAAIQAGYYHSCAQMTDATLRCWGNNFHGQIGVGAAVGIQVTPASVPGLGAPVVEAALGLHHSCAALSDSRMRCWGLNAEGQVGSGELALPLSRREPVSVAGLGSGVVTLDSGYDHTCAIISSGAMKCWGNNSSAQLGDGTAMRRFAPVTVSGVSGAAQAVATGSDHTCALVGSTVRCWGSNYYSQLGSPDALPPHPPVWVPGLAGTTTSISAGAYHTCALNSAGKVTCWGISPFGFSGHPGSLGGMLDGITAVAAGGDHSCALTTTGTVKCWGDNSNGQFGSYEPDDSPYAALPVTGFSGVVTSLSAGLEHSCAVLSMGRVECWGSTSHGQGGDPGPVGFFGLESVQMVRAGGSHNCALTTVGGVKCWGNNEFGQLGDGTTTTAYVPVNVIGLGSGVKAISVGETHSCALTTSGAVKCWGDSRYGQVGDGSFPGVAAPDWVRWDPAFFRDGFEAAN